MKRVAIVLSLVLISLAGAVAEEEETYTLTIGGEGTVAVPADIVFVTVSVVTTGENFTQVSDESAENLNRTIEAMVDVGFEREDMLSGRGRSTQRIQTYSKVCNNTTCVIVEDAVVSQIKDQFTIQLSRDDEDALNRCVETAEREGASAAITGYKLTDPGPARAEARRKAVENAKENAEDLASAAGLKLGKTQDIFETSHPEMYSRYFVSNSPSQGWTMNFFGWPGSHTYDMYDPFGASSSAEPGMIGVTSYVVVTYEVSQ